MRRCLMGCVMLLASCGSPETVRRVAVVPPVSADLRTGCPGWQGRPPVTVGQLLDAGAAEKAGRLCANAKIEAIDKILGPQ